MDETATAKHDRELSLASRWHAETAGFALAILASRVEGLTEDEAAQRLGVYGPNEPPCAPPRGPFARFVSQFNNILIYVLLLAAAVSLALGHWVDALVIAAVVLANGVIGFVQEGRAERALDAIRELVSRQATVTRDGRRRSLPAKDVVPGDVVILEAGDRVPADVRLLRASSLRIDEAMLTGESIAPEKTIGSVASDAPLGDRRCMAYSGALVVAGQGAGVVTATGARTEIGRITTLLGQVEPLTTPLLAQMNRFARVLTAAILGVSAAVFGLATVIHGTPWSEAFMAVVGLAVAAIPEGLPAVMTITLAIGVQRMAARKAVIRRLPAVETLGSVSVICSDKTGTLTRNEMTVRTTITRERTYEVTGSGYAPTGEFRASGDPASPSGSPVLQAILQGSLLCNDAALRRWDSGWRVEGDPLEGALLALAIKGGLDPDAERARLPRLAEIPFDSQHRFMATMHALPGEARMIFVKGAPESIIAMCATQCEAAGVTAVERAWWLDQAETAAASGQRVLAIAMKRAPSSEALTFAEVECDMTLLGLLCLVDPPREEAEAAVRECQSAGVRIKMITGDHAATAGAIADALGIHGDVVSGRDLDNGPDRRFRETVRRATVFARTTPEHKLRIVQALQADGEIVAMTGDGVNDAPALKQADVGVAMGRKGTEAAKEAAEMVLVDDNFASIVAAIREGRTVYDNLTKVIAWTLPTNGGEALTIIAAMLLGLTLPITPVQILWVNMNTAATLGLTLAFEPPEPEAMRRPPRPRDEPILSGLLAWRIVLVSMLFLASTFGMFAWARQHGLAVEEARTIVVNTMVVLEIFYLFSVRYLRSASMTWRGVVGATPVLVGVAAVTLAQAGFTYLGPMQLLFDSRPLSLFEVAAIVANGVGLLIILEAEKRVARLLGRRPRAAKI